MANIEKRTCSDGTSSYRVRVKFKTHPIQSATFASMREAKAWATATEAKVREGHYFKDRVLRQRTLAEFIDRYTGSVLVGKRNARNQRSHLRWWRQRLGRLPVGEITRATITACRDELLTGQVRDGRTRASATVVRYLAALSHVYTVAIRDWEWTDANPVRMVRKPKEPRPIRRWWREGRLDLASALSFERPSAMGGGLSRGAIHTRWSSPRNCRETMPSWGRHLLSCAGGRLNGFQIVRAKPSSCGPQNARQFSGRRPYRALGGRRISPESGA